jgi:hypothetical protein
MGKAFQKWKLRNDAMEKVREASRHGQVGLRQQRADQ